MPENITIPERVEAAIGYSGWTALSWALQNGWVQDYKWLFSQREGRDVGTPETVEAIVYGSGGTVAKSQLLSQGALFLFLDRLEMEKRHEAVKLMIEGYLLGTDYVSPLWVIENGMKQKQTGVILDEHGANQLEGELRRHWAKKNGVLQPREVCLTKAVIDDYCATYQLNGASDRFAERLNL